MIDRLMLTVNRLMPLISKNTTRLPKHARHIKTKGASHHVIGFLLGAAAQVWHGLVDEDRPTWDRVRCRLADMLWFGTVWIDKNKRKMTSITD